jgi:hypothetical protein
MNTVLSRFEITWKGKSIGYFGHVRKYYNLINGQKIDQKNKLQIYIDFN